MENVTPPLNTVRYNDETERALRRAMLSLTPDELYRERIKQIALCLAAGITPPKPRRSRQGR